MEIGERRQIISRRFSLDTLLLLAILLLALATRLPGLDVFLTADEARSWFGRSIIFLDSLARGDLANTAPGGEVPYIANVSLSPGPGVTTMWSGAIGLVLAYLRQGAPGPLTDFLRSVPFDPLDPAMLPFLRLTGVLVAAITAGLTFRWSRPLVGRPAAFLAAALVALDPFYLALSRVLGHDALVSSFMWLSVLAFLRAMHHRQTGSAGSRQDTIFLVVSGACAGLAVLSKYPALFLGGFVGLFLLVFHLARRDGRAPRQVALMLLRDLFLWSVSAAAVMVLLWPAMWVDPLTPLVAIFTDALRASGSAHQKGSFFLGRPVPDPGALFYPLVVVFRTTPVVFLGFLVWLWSLARGRKPAGEETIPAPRSLLLLTLLAYILLYGLLVTYGGKKQDRYILPAFPAMAMLAAVGYLYIATVGGRLRQTSFRAWLVPVGAVLVQLVLVVPYFPYYFTYYNPLAGGGRAAVALIPVGWGEGLNEAAAYLNRLPEAEALRVTSWYSTTFEPFFKGQAIYKLEDEKISRSPKPGLAADYVVFYVNQVQRELPSAGALQFFRARPPVHTVTLNGIDYAWIYPSLGVEHIFAGEARLVGQAELLGYTLTDEAGQPVAALFPESVGILSLYWEWQGKSPDDPLGLSLVDETGKTRGWGNPIETTAPLPFEQWQEGMVVRSDFALVIFPDTPPGDYRLSVWIDRPATGETVGVFPLEEVIRVVPR
ncbi:MAG: phospholipid carrier-dependent glycosyltransferase [Chloroflexi bacterium]|nr:MAG: phospholipid carrier-dependent glycosyltransferase [Chloroflexota bacterium]